MAEPKEKPATSLRNPKPKKTLGLSVPSALRLPHDDLIKPEASSTPVTPVTVVTSVTPVTGDAAPKRDFTRTANSIVRDAIPAGLFSGKGKQLYDYLYLKTRGAIVPKHSARIPTGDVMKGAGMTRHTYRAHLQKLVSSGMVKVDERPGEHGGNIFTIYLPEEIGINRGDRGDRGDRGVTVQDRDMVQGSELDRGDRGLIVDAQRGSDAPKTSFKTKEENLDDEAAPLGELFRELEREMIGKNAASVEQWRDLRDLISTEVKIAAARTTVSNVPAFLTEHLRRRLWKIDQKRASEIATAPEQESTPTLSDGERRRCPDCAGTNFYYPEGPEKGVAKCKHQKLQSVPQ